MVTIDLNSDMGEAFGAWRMGDDEALLDVVTSANIACGFHAGDARVMARTVADAAERGVALGAHVSYPDLVGFGRRGLDATPSEVATDVLYQLGALDAFARARGSRVAYVKPHGALYNDIAEDEEKASAVIDAITDFDRHLPLLTLPESAAMRVAARRGVHTVAEAFADRAYNADGTLVSRRVHGAVLHDPDDVVERCVRLVTEGKVTAADGSTLHLDVSSLCVHGDSPGAVSIARAVREGLQQAGVAVEAFAG